MFQLDAVGGGKGYYLLIEGDRQRDALALFAMEMAAEHDEGRIGWNQPAGRSDHLVFWDAGIPAVLLTWKEASDENLPAELADEVDAYKLGVAGRTISLGLMILAE